MISVNTIQREYCKGIQENIRNRKSKTEHIPIFWKNENYQTGKPILTSFYLKPVIVMAPHLNFPNIKSLPFKWNLVLDECLNKCVLNSERNNNGTINWNSVQENWQKEQQLHCDTLKLKNRYRLLETVKMPNGGIPETNREENLSEICNSLNNSIANIDAVHLPNAVGKSFTLDENNLLQYLIEQPKNKSGSTLNWSLIHKSFLLEARKRKLLNASLVFYERTASSLNERHKTIKKAKKD